jgi:pyruvate kinase
MGTSIAEINHELVSLQLEELGSEMRSVEKGFKNTFDSLHRNNQISAANLIHYLVLRRTEIRLAQEYLHKIGLSSLTSCESHVLSQVNNVLKWLAPDHPRDLKINCSFEVASKLRQVNRESLLGADTNIARPHIMVTLSAELANDRMQMEELLLAGMTVARINCAHDSPQVWLALVETLKKSMAKTGNACKLYMDLGGPKIRVKSIYLKGVSRDKIKVKEGDELILTGSFSAKRKLDRKALLIVAPAEIIKMMKPGEHVFFDDGKFEGKIMQVSAKDIAIRITRISTQKPFLKVEKGINLPDSELRINPLTKSDLSYIPFICKYADMVGYSFVSTPLDVDQLRQEVKKHQSKAKTPPAIILKIERLTAVQNLPGLLLTGMKDQIFGVMIARGDLAVEIGFERLSEIQEEILWICEAAHVPVIWATQVLETMNKTGFATRSEMTDAGMGVMAECVMLNKGKYLVKTIHALDNILKRQMGHVDKKRYIMRPLGIAKNFLDDTILYSR